jgi:hypothetical protein
MSYSIQPTETRFQLFHNFVLDFLVKKGVRDPRLFTAEKRVLMQMTDTGAPIDFVFSSGKTVQPSDSIDRYVLQNELFIPFGTRIGLRRVAVSTGKELFGNSVLHQYPDAEIHTNTNEVVGLESIYNGSSELSVGEALALKWLNAEFRNPNSNNVGSAITERLDPGAIHFNYQHFPALNGNVTATVTMKFPPSAITLYPPEAANPKDHKNYIEYGFTGVSIDMTQDGITQTIISDLQTAWNQERKFYKCA